MRTIINFFRHLFGFNIVSAPMPAPYPESSEPSTPAPQDESSDGPGFNIEIGEIISKDDKEHQICLTSIINVRDIIASRFFKEEVMAARFTNAGGLTNKQIYNMFIKTKLVVNIRMFYGSWWQNHRSKTVGYDVATDDFVHANRFFVYKSTTLTSLNLHEIAHSLGFHHNSPREYTSVPHQMNYIADIVMAKLGIDDYS